MEVSDGVGVEFRPTPLEIEIEHKTESAIAEVYVTPPDRDAIPLYGRRATRIWKRGQHASNGGGRWRPPTDAYWPTHVEVSKIFRQVHGV